MGRCLFRPLEDISRPSLRCPPGGLWEAASRALRFGDQANAGQPLVLVLLPNLSCGQCRALKDWQWYGGVQKVYVEKVYVFFPPLNNMVGSHDSSRTTSEPEVLVGCMNFPGLSRSNKGKIRAEFWEGDATKHFSLKQRGFQ